MATRAASRRTRRASSPGRPRAKEDRSGATGRKSSSAAKPVRPGGADPALIASELRVVLGGLTRRLRSEHGFPLSHGAVLGRLDRGGARSVSELAVAERVRPQSMAQTVTELEADGLVARRPDPKDGRRALVALTDEGTAVLQADRRQREGWLARTIAEELSSREQATLAQASELLRRLAES